MHSDVSEFHNLSSLKKKFHPWDIYKSNCHFLSPYQDLVQQLGFQNERSANVNYLNMI